MAWKSVVANVAGLVASCLLWTPARAGDAVTVRVVRPVEQGERLIGLFRGARAPHPAASLSAWKHANGGRSSLGKPLEAAIAALNPPMVRELKSFDGAEVFINFAPGRWRASLPNDDGSVAALGPALALTDGGIEPLIGALTVFRLGPAGSTLAAGRPGLFALASSREGLELALDDTRADVSGDGGLLPGLHARLDPTASRVLSTIRGRRIAEALDAVGCREVRARAGLDDDDSLTLRVTTALEKPRRRAGEGPRLDPAWLGFVPRSGTLAAVSVALETSPESLADAFAVLDRVERADPARAGAAPIRARLNLLAALARVQPEVDLWPLLKGLTAAVLVGPDGEISGALVVLHATDEAASGRIADNVIPRLASAFSGSRKPSAVAPDGVRRFGTVGGKSLSAERRETNLVIGWGDEALSAARGASLLPDRQAGLRWKSQGNVTAPRRAGGFWPWRSSRFVPPGSSLALALAEAPPIVWEGTTDESTARDLIRWSDLRTTIRRGLDALPLDPRADRSVPPTTGDHETVMPPCPD